MQDLGQYVVSLWLSSGAPLAPPGYAYRGADHQVAVGPPSSDPAVGRIDARHPAPRYVRWPVVGAAPVPRWEHPGGAYPK